MSDLVEFLRARLDEDAATARAADGDAIEATFLYEGVSYLTMRGDHEDRYTGELPAPLADHIARHDPARVLAEVESRRRILDDVLPTMQSDELRIAGEWGVGSDPVREASDDLLSFLALPYADHPDYRAEWRAGQDTP